MIMAQMQKQLQWVVITGGGSGIGRMLCQKFSQTHRVLICGRRRESLEETKRDALVPSNVTIVVADIAQEEDRKRFTSVITTAAAAEKKNSGENNDPTKEEGQEVYLLIQNAAIGDPAEDLLSVDPAHLEHALQVNVVAPLALVQLLQPALQRCNISMQGQGGRVLHLGTSVAHRPQPGTLTYGVTKMAFHRLYQQLNVENAGNADKAKIVCGSMSPGLVDTEGVRDHVAKARTCGLGHVAFFDQAFEQKKTTDLDQLFHFVQELLEMDSATFSSKEWRFSQWQKNQQNH
jgi:NAD(P)-dependent dehydrogenase (short-subunit alcohol dehydrogenase family)